MARLLLYLNSDATRRVERQLDKVLNMLERQWRGVKSIVADEIAHHCWAAHRFGATLLSKYNYLGAYLAVPLQCKFAGIISCCIRSAASEQWKAQALNGARSCLPG